MKVTLTLVGLSHHTAPLELREQFFLTAGELCTALQGLRQAGLAEAAILSTCNRLEVYAVSDSDARSAQDVAVYLAESRGLRSDTLAPFLYVRHDSSVIDHLMRVACGIESLALGETQILGQVVNALAHAQAAGAAGPILSRLFTDAIHTGKRARTETAISRHTLSVSHAAALLVRRELADVAKARILLVGAGRMAELVVRALKAQGAAEVRIANRTDTKAQMIARRLGASAVEWQRLHDELAASDAVITAAGSPHPILHHAELQPALARHDGAARSAERVVVDIGVPRNVDEQVGHLPGVRLYDLDDLQSVVAGHRERRQAEVAQVEGIVAVERARCLAWLNSRSVVETITSMRQSAAAVAQAELELALRRLPDLDNHEREVVQQMAHRIVGKLLHTPTVTLKARAAEGDHFTYRHAVHRLFGLGESPEKDGAYE